MTTDEMMTIARECASTGNLPKAKVLREFMAALVGAPAPSVGQEHADPAAPAHADPADDDRELRHLRIENAELHDAVERSEAAMAALRASVDAFPPGAVALAEAVAHGLPKLDPSAMLALGDLDCAQSPVLIERTSTGNLVLVAVPMQITPAEARALARDLARAGAA